jgi:hypothetical protein
MDSNFKRVRKAKLDKDLKQVDKSHLEVMKAIEGTNPKYAKHMFLKNDLIENFARQAFGGVEILDQPVCTHCEKPAAWHEGGSAYCFSCNKTIPAKDVITVLDYLIEYTDTIPPEKLEILKKLGDVKDEVTGKNKIIL